MKIASKMVRPFLFCCLLGLVQSHLKYENHLSVLNRIPSIMTNEMLFAKALLKNLEQVNTKTFLSVLVHDFDTQRYQASNHISSDLKFHSELSQKNTMYETTVKRFGALGIREQCSADMFAYLQHVKLNLTSAEEWALRMADATGKPGSGILSGSFTFLGDFDECRAVTAKYKSIFPVAKERIFLGQYCLGQYNINIPPIPQKGFNHKWGFCIPDSCNEQDALQISNLALKRYNITQISFESMTCNMRHVPWTPRAVGVFTMIGVIAFLVAIGTALDIVLLQLPKWRKRKEESIDYDNNINGDQISGTVLPRDDENFRAHNDTEPLNINGKAALAKMEEQPTRQSLVVKIFVAFSAYTNAQKLLNFKQAPGTLTCLNGIRVISINWVVLGHTCLFMFTAANNIGAFLQDALNRYTFQVIVNATFSVDTFFVMSGLLVAYATLNQMKKTRGKTNWLKFYLHRYMRLTPVYMITLGFYLACIPYLVDGPLLPQRDGFEQDHHCQHNWWGNLLYVQNLVRFKPHYCAGWAWYLAVDMQFYIISPLMLIPLFHKPKLGYLVCALFFLMTTITPMVLVETRLYPAGRTHLQGNPKPLGDENYDIYIAPYCRMGSYLVGVLTGYVLYRTKDQTVRIPRAVVVLAWAVSIVLGVLVVYGLKDYYLEKGMNIHLSAVYTAFSRIAWSMAVGWVIFSCHNGYGGFINSFLSWTIWIPLARLTYVVYLIHMILLFILGSTSRTAFALEDWSIVRLYLCALTLSYSAAIVVTLFFEAPGLALEKVLFAKKKR